MATSGKRPKPAPVLRIVDPAGRGYDRGPRNHSELVRLNHPSLQPPYDAFWGARYAIVEDPNGIAVGIMSPVSDEYKSPPPTP
jgi:hypothetical protein